MTIIIILIINATKWYSSEYQWDWNWRPAFRISHVGWSDDLKGSMSSSRLDALVRWQFMSLSMHTWSWRYIYSSRLNLFSTALAAWIARVRIYNLTSMVRTSIALFWRLSGSSLKVFYHGCWYRYGELFCDIQWKMIGTNGRPYFPNLPFLNPPIKQTDRLMIIIAQRVVFNR